MWWRSRRMPCTSAGCRGGEILSLPYLQADDSDARGGGGAGASPWVEGNPIFGSSISKPMALAPFWAEDTFDGEGDVVDEDALADGVLVGEEVARRRRPQDADSLHAALVILVQRFA